MTRIALLASLLAKGEVMTPDELRRICREIAHDMEMDAVHFDGKPFDGRTVAEYFGNQGAAIAALAKIVEVLLKRSQPQMAMKQEAP